MIRGCIVPIVSMRITKMILISLQLGERLTGMVRTTPHLPMARVLVMDPVVAIVIQLIRVPAVLVGTNVRAEVVDEMGSKTQVSSVTVASDSTGASLLPRLSSKSSSRTKGEAVWALEKLFVGLRCWWGRKSHCISCRLPR